MHHLSFSGKILKKWLLQTCVSSYCSIALHYDNLWQIKLQRSFVRKWNIFFVELNVHIVRMVLEIQWYELRLLSLKYHYHHTVKYRKLLTLGQCSDGIIDKASACEAQFVRSKKIYADSCGVTYFGKSIHLNSKTLVSELGRKTRQKYKNKSLITSKSIHKVEILHVWWGK